MSETRFTGVYDAVLLSLNHNFNPRNMSPKERSIYISAFIECVKTNNLERVPRYLEALNVNECEESTNNALHYCNSLAMMELLLARGANVMAVNKLNVLPIAFSRSVDIFKRFVDEMRKLNAPIPLLNAPMASSGLTFFQLLISAKSFELVEWLVKGEGAKYVDQPVPELIHVVSAQLDTMKIAIQSDAPQWFLADIYAALPDSYRATNDNFKMFILATILGGAEGVKFFAPLIPATGIDGEFSENRVTALQSAVAYFNLETAKVLIELGSNPNKICGKGCCSVAAAALRAKGSSEKRVAFLQMLSDNGAHFSEVLSDGNNLMSLALNQREIDCKALEFLASRAPAEAFTFFHDNDTLAHLAIRKSSSQEPLKIILKYAPRGSIQLDAVNGSKHLFPPLCMAAENGWTESCRLLLAHGADPDGEILGIKASTKAYSAKHYELAKELQLLETDEPLCCCWC